MLRSKNNLSISLVVILTFALALYTSRDLRSDLGITIDGHTLRIIYYYACWTIPTLLVTGLLFGFSNIIEEIGLSHGFLRGLGFGLVCVAPMMIGSFFTGTVNTELGFIRSLLEKGLRPGFFEEFLFRGFLFGLLFRRAGWGFIPAALLGAVIFGLSHIYQGNTLGQTVGIFSVTLMGSFWFAWLYIEWNENLWVPIFLHTLMNFSWIYFDISDSGALGGMSANIFRALTITISILLTVRYNKTKDRFCVNRENLFVNYTR